MKDKNMYGSLVADKIYANIGSLEGSRTMIITDSEERFKGSPSDIYVTKKVKEVLSRKGNIEIISLEGEVNDESLSSYISSKEVEYDSVMVQLPVKGVDIENVVGSIPHNKDIDGFNPTNLGNLVRGKECLLPCTPKAVMEILEYYGINVVGKIVSVVGRSNLVGKPLAIMLINAGATVISCNSKTNLVDVLPLSDIVISAIGKPKYIGKELIKEGAILIDVGINRDPITNRLVGDFNYDDVYDKCSMITPVPGGVGPVTVACLIHNIKNTIKGEK